MVGFLDQNTRITRITAVSPTARNRMETEAYRVQLTEDEIIPETIVEILLRDLVTDLYTIGIELHCSLSDLIDTYVHVDYLVEISSYYLPEPLTKKLSHDYRLQRALENILENGNAAAASPGGAYLQHLGLNEDCYNKNLEIACHWLLDKLVSTEEFIPYIQNVLTISASAAVAHKPVDDQLGGYIRYLEILQNRMDACIHVLERYRSLFNDGAIETIRTRLKLYLNTLSQQDIAHFMSHVFLPTSATVGDSLETLSKYRNFCLGEKVFVDYYKNPNTASMTTVDIVTILVRTISEISAAEYAPTAIRRLTDAIIELPHQSTTHALLTILTPQLLNTIPTKVS